MVRYIIGHFRLLMFQMQVRSIKGAINQKALPRPKLPDSTCWTSLMRLPRRLPWPLPCSVFCANCCLLLVGFLRCVLEIEYHVVSTTINLYIPIDLVGWRSLKILGVNHQALRAQMECEGRGALCWGWFCWEYDWLYHTMGCAGLGHQRTPRISGWWTFVDESLSIMGLFVYKYHQVRVWRACKRAYQQRWEIRTSVQTWAFRKSTNSCQCLFTLNIWAVAAKPLLVDDEFGDCTTLLIWLVVWNIFYFPIYWE